MGQPLIAETVHHRSDESAAQRRSRRLARSAALQLRLMDAAATARSVPQAREPAPILRFQPTLAAQPAPALDPRHLVQATVGPRPGLRAIALDDSDQPAALLGQGDVVWVQSGEAAPVDGELWALRLPGRHRPVLRRVYTTASQWRLQPDNRSFPPETIAPADVQLDGRVVAVLRQHD